MVDKAAIFGAGTLISISAPTSHAIARATKHGLTLVSIARRDGAVVFTDQLAPDHAEHSTPYRAQVRTPLQPSLSIDVGHFISDRGSANGT
jgi:hypothetical protein